MTFSEITTKAKKHQLFLFVLGLFLIKGLVLVYAFPLFQQPDEQIHYASVLMHAEPDDKPWQTTTIDNSKSLDPGNITSYHLPEEILQHATATQFNDTIWNPANSTLFSDSLTGPDEAMLRTEEFKRYLDLSPTNASTLYSVYYSLGATLDNLNADEPLIERFFTLRLFSLFLFGLLIVVISYAVALTLGFTVLESTLFMTLVAFHPGLSVMASQVNVDIALVLAFSFFFLAALRLIELPTSISAVTLLTLSVILGIASKGPGLVLIPVALCLALYLTQRHFQFKWQDILLKTAVLGVILGLIIMPLVPTAYVARIANLGAESQFETPLESIATYADKTLGTDSFKRTNNSYWGNYGWLDTRLSSPVLTLIWVIEILAYLGVILFLWAKKTPDYLVKKPVIYLALGMIIALQLAIRFYDWRVFDELGKVVIGTPGRYFLPNIIPHLLLVVTGLGYILTKNRSQFVTLLKTLALTMILLSLYALYNVIIPRYYL